MRSLSLALTLFGCCFVTLPGFAQRPSAPPLAEPAAREAFQESVFREHIEYLSHADQHGRGRLGYIAASDYLAKQFEQLELKPLFEESFFQKIPGATVDNRPSAPGGRNVGAILAGSDPVLKNEYIIVSAHYDHLGRRGEIFFPGADDNASGTSMLLEVARAFSLAEPKPRRSILFVGFDLEERLLFGSRWFVANPPVPLEKIKCVFVADMIGRSLGGLDLQSVFVMGSEHSPQLVQALDAVKPTGDLKPARLGIDLIGVRSDYGPFWNEQIPFLFFSSGEHPDYHKPTDTAEKINLPQVVAVSRMIYELVERLANQPDAPVWQEEVAPSLDEVKAVRQIATSLLENQNPDKPLGPSQLLLLTHVRGQAKKIIDKGEISASERKWLIRVSQLLLFSVL